MLQILSRLGKLNTSSDFAKALPDLDGAIDDVKTRITDLRAKLRSAPFDSTEAEVRTLRQEVRDLEDELETLHGAREEAEARRAQAAAAEDEAALQARMAAAAKTRRALRDAFLKFDQQAADLAATLTNIRSLRSDLDAANAEARAAGRADLVLNDPINILRATTDRHINDPAAHGGTTIVGVWPSPHPDGSPLPRLRDLKL